MTAVSILLFEQTQAWACIGQSEYSPMMARQMHGAVELLDVDLPVRPQLKRSAKGQQ
jgi:hypothetical protein